MAETIISIKGLSVSYDRKRILSNIYLNIEQGYLYGLVGPNGAGKSTLFKAILGLLEPNAGEVLVFGKPIKANQKKMVYVPQTSQVDWTFPATVYDITLMGRYPHKKILQRMSAEDHAITLNALREVGIEHLRERQIGELSGGQQQRVFLARALCQQADIFLLDEPFVGVDMTTEESIIKILHQLASQGKTILVVHHDLSNVISYFDKVILLNQRLIAFGDVATVFTQENIAKAYSSQLPILHQTGLLNTK